MAGDNGESRISSVLGIDFGNQNCSVAVKTKRWIEVVLNEYSAEEIPSVVFFHDKYRAFGTKADSYSMARPMFAISELKRFIGVPFSDPELQKDLKRLPLKVSEGPDGYPLFHVKYLGQARTFTPTEVLGMVFSNLKEAAQEKLDADLRSKYAPLKDCCIGIPAFFSNLQRQAVLDAAKIAGLNPLQLIHETTATALAFGVYRTNLAENEHANAVFVDIGHASMQVCVARYEKGKLQILSHSFDRSLGGRDFDELLFKNFVAKIKGKYKIDITRKRSATFLLRVACEELKIFMCANPEAPLHHLLVEQFDFAGVSIVDRVKLPLKAALASAGLPGKKFDCYVKWEDFEEMSIPLLDRIKIPLQNTLEEAHLAVQDIHAVELSGSGSRFPAIVELLSDFFGRKPERRINGNGCVKGCALQCEILTTAFKTREFMVNERFPFPVTLSWTGSVPCWQEMANNSQSSTVLFPKGSPIPSVKACTFYGQNTFTIEFWYGEVGDSQQAATRSSYEIGPFPSTMEGRAKVELVVCLNLHGIVLVESATVVKLQTAMISRKRYNIWFPEVLSQEHLRAAVRHEQDMTIQDSSIKLVKDEKKAMQDYITHMLSMLGYNLEQFVVESEKKELRRELEKLRRELGPMLRDCEPVKEDVRSRYQDLKEKYELAECRYKDSIQRGLLINKLDFVITSFRELAMSTDLDSSEKEKVLNECEIAEVWLREERREQDLLPAYECPVLLLSMLHKKANELESFCRSIMTKPKPKPKPALLWPQIQLHYVNVTAAILIFATPLCSLVRRQGVLGRLATEVQKDKAVQKTPADEAAI